MKTRLLLVLALGLFSVCRAGPLGWFTSKARDWNFVQQCGGIKMGEPTKKNGRLILPVEFSAQGLVAVTRQPKLLNSGLAVRKITARQEGSSIVIKVVTQIAEKDSDTGLWHDVDLSGIPAGSYVVYYQDAHDFEKRLGLIQIE